MILPVMSGSSLLKGMTEKDLIKQLKSFRKIKPSKDWVVSLKSEILQRDQISENKLSFVETIKIVINPTTLRPVFATVLSIFVIFGLFNFAQGSLPGELLYPMKKLAEKGQTIFASDNQKTNLQLKFVDQRVQELTEAASRSGANSSSISAAFQALNKDLSVVSEQIQLGNNNEELAVKTEELIKKTQAALIGLEGKNDGIDSALQQIVSREITDLEKRNLTDEQKAVLNEVKIDFANGNYGTALEKIWKIGDTESVPQIELQDENGNPIQGVDIKAVPANED